MKTPTQWANLAGTQEFEMPHPTEHRNVYLEEFIANVQRDAAGRNWKRVARRLRTKYRQKLAIERARTQSTKEALNMMIQELAKALIAQVEQVDEDWDKN
jgi:hypothetical protein